MMQEEKVPRVLPPLVKMPEINERSMEITFRIVEKVLPAAQPGRLSTASSEEIENGIDVSAFALCWYLAALRDPFRRDLLTKNLLDKVFSLVCAVEAAGISITEGIDIGEALCRVADNVERAASAKRDRQTSPAVRRPGHSRFRLRSRGKKQTAQQKEANPATRDTRNRILPSLVIWPCIPKRCAKQVAHLLSNIEGGTTPGRLSTTSDESIEEPARSSHLALCWFLGSLGDMSGADQIALRWVEEVPRLVGLTCAIATAEQTGVTARQALDKMGVRSAECEIEIGGESCIWWLDANGDTRISGPKEVQPEIDQMVRGHDFLQNISEVIGINVNTVGPDALDGILRCDHHELAELVADGSDLDVSEHEFQARKQGCYSDDGVISQIAIRTAGRNTDRTDVKQHKQAIQRSILIRLHMMEAKIEKRKRIRLN